MHNLRDSYEAIILVTNTQVKIVSTSEVHCLPVPSHNSSFPPEVSDDIFLFSVFSSYARLEAKENISVFAVTLNFKHINQAIKFPSKA